MKAKAMRYISRDTRRERWKVRIERLEGNVCLSFADSTYGDKSASKKAAQAARNERLKVYTKRPDPQHQFTKIERYIYERIRYRAHSISAHIEVKCKRLQLFEQFSYSDSMGRDLAIQCAQATKKRYGLYDYDN